MFGWISAKRYKDSAAASPLLSLLNFTGHDRSGKANPVEESYIYSVGWRCSKVTPTSLFPHSSLSGPVMDQFLR